MKHRVDLNTFIWMVTHRGSTYPEWWVQQIHECIIVLLYITLYYYSITVSTNQHASPAVPDAVPSGKNYIETPKGMTRSSACRRRVNDTIPQRWIPRNLINFQDLLQQGPGGPPPLAYHAVFPRSCGALTIKLPIDTVAGIKSVASTRRPATKT